MSVSSLLGYYKDTDGERNNIETTIPGPKQTDTRARASLINVRRKKKKKKSTPPATTPSCHCIHHRNVAEKKKRLVIKQPKTSPLVFHCIVGAHKGKGMSGSLCVLPRDRKERIPLHSRSHSGRRNPIMDIVASNTGPSFLRSDL